MGWVRYGALLLTFCAPGAASASDARFAFFTYEGQRQERAIAQPRPGEYVNPILAGYAPDPSVVRVKDDYYLVNSSFAHWPGLPIYHSKDLTSWTQIGNAVDRASQIKLGDIGVSRGLFAPDISYRDGTFYIINTCVDCGGNFMITAKNPAGPWSDPVWFEFDGIDPSIFWDDNGKAYVVNNGKPDEKPRYQGHRAIWIQELNPRTSKLEGPRAQIVNGGVDISKEPIWIEGPHLFKTNGYYYLICAEGGTADQHSEVVFRSRQVTGPFEPYSGNPILTQRDLPAAREHPITSAGHAKLVQTQKGDWWAVFLAVRPYAPDRYNIGRETFLLPVTWKDGWPTILEHSARIPFVAKKPDLPSQPAPALPTSGDFSYTDNFDSKVLSFAWLGIRAPKVGAYQIKGGDLVLSTPAFIGRRQQHHIATVTTALTYAPTQDGERAGLAAIASDEAQLFFGIAREQGQTAIVLTDGKQILASAPIQPTGPVYLKLSFNAGSGEVAYAQTKDRWITLKSGFDATFLDTHRAGGFVGTVIGVQNLNVTSKR
jgi:alpha-N-arabinofuranosidase